MTTHSHKQQDTTTMADIELGSITEDSVAEEVLATTEQPSEATEDYSVSKDAVRHPTLEELNGFWERQAKRVARNPCMHLWFFLLLGIILSAIAMIVGEFEVSAETGGWQSRGTMVADRQTQVMMVELNIDSLLTGGEEAWKDLIENVQPGWEEDLDDDDDDDDDDESRRLKKQVATDNSAVRSMMDYLHPHSSFSTSEHRQVPFKMTSSLKRRLDEVNPTGLLEGCDVEWYTSGNLTGPSRLWPIWKTTRSTSSALDPDIIHDICVAEQKTQAHLEEKGLCTGCETDGKCLQPYSIVFFARLTVPNGMSLSCEELRDAWIPYQESTETQWKTCVEQIKETYDPNNDGLPESCPFGFLPTLVDETFDSNLVSTYTSSIFATEWNMVDELFEEVDYFHQGSSLVQGVYDTQYEDFVNIHLDESLPQDMALAMGSAVIVSVAILLHTRSPFITIIGLVQIILSFPLSYFVYKLLAGLNFFPFLNFIGIFVVFALGAGDVFVAVDKWKNARLEHPSATTEYVAAVALPDAASAMFLTTLTTAIAFLATAICPVAPIKMFAIFCGLLVIFDYIMNILLVFPALCIYDKAIMARGHQGVNCCVSITCCSCFARKDKSGEDDMDASDSSSGDVEDFKPNLIGRILLAFYEVLHLIRWPLFGLCVVAMILTTYFASTLEMPTSSDVRLLDDSIQFEKNYLWRQNLLSETLEKAGGSQAYVVWGLSPADTGDQNDPASWSQLVLDKSFAPSSEDAQVFLSDFCEKLLDEEFASPVEDDYVCPMQGFEAWLEANSNPSNATDAASQAYIDHCDGASGLPISPDTFHPCITAWAQEVGETSVLSRGGKVQIMLFPFTSRVRYDDHYDTLDEEWHLIEDWMNLQNQAAPSGVRRGYFSSFDFWWYDTNGQMLKTAYSAAAIALGCAAAVILFSSRSLLLTLFSTLTIGYVLTSVTATLVALGWTLGFLEAICFAILIGVSVDFVIHFSHAYTVLKGTVDRHTRTKYALIKMGPSILATAATTILSAVIMLFTVITFFQKFALILFFTVIQASLGSFVILLVLLDCFGPSNPTYLIDRFVVLLRKAVLLGEDEAALNNESERTATDNDSQQGGDTVDDGSVSWSLFWSKYGRYVIAGQTAVLLIFIIVVASYAPY